MPAYAARLGALAYDIRGQVQQEAARMEEAGLPVMRLNLGDPAQFGFTAPADVVAEVARLLGRAQGYSEAKGLAPARARVAGYCRGKAIPVRDGDDVYLGNGVSELIIMAAHSLFDEGDEILIPAPDYPLWTAAVRLAGGRSVHYPCDERAGWLPDIAAIGALITRRTKAIVVINPNNPTGAVYPADVLDDILGLARRHGLAVLSDEIYDQLVYEGEHVSAAARAPDVPCLTFNGLSKAYLLAGYRSGWLAVTGPAAETAGLRRNLDLLAGMRLCPNVPGQWAITVALSAPGQIAADLVLPGGRLREQRDAAWRALTALPGVSCVRPQGALYAFPRLDPAVWHIDDDERFVLGLLREQRVLLVHGRAFNLKDREHLRLVILAPVADLLTAVQRMGAFLSGRRGVTRRPVHHRVPAGSAG